MTWAFVDVEIADLFEPLPVPDVWSVAWSPVEDSRTYDAVQTAKWAESRESKRRARMADDPAYAARRKAQLRAAYLRSKAKRKKARRG